ncbi:hypothetical protein [Tunicatimonas pelagia]|uniref:hypothetical protein n=1 Tax=Tunicatimonas pelagia TaxID=931531 RepID=UPI0026658F75|nr:hypothetical protein [Tunicatimonas pelagia]WKN44335.1 hypothetical protein P0M28_05075 [Tunicatimonas pelagia]
MKLISFAAYALLISTVLLFTACNEDDDVPPEENPEEQITRVILTFTPDGGGDTVTATWEDPDGEGSEDPVKTDIALAASTTYTLRIELFDALDPDDIENKTEEIENEDDEHMFFFGWDDEVFTDPEGDGNIDARADLVNYEDQDGGGLPLGLETRWTTGDATNGMFTVVLKHQPPLDDGTPIKTATSTATDGTSDIEIDWNIAVQ